MIEGWGGVSPLYFVFQNIGAISVIWFSITGLKLFVARLLEIIVLCLSAVQST